MSMVGTIQWKGGKAYRIQSMAFDLSASSADVAAAAAGYRHVVVGAIIQLNSSVVFTLNTGSGPTAKATLRGGVAGFAFCPALNPSGWMQTSAGEKLSVTCSGVASGILAYITVEDV